MASAVHNEKAYSKNADFTVIRYIATLAQELRPMLRLAAPLVLAELGWMGMGIVDTMMVGRVSATAMGTVSLGSVLFYTVAIFGSGLMLGLLEGDTSGVPQ
jgi:Na+-driven multidrug efflux pump